MSPLSTQPIDDYRGDGFLVLRGLFSSAECAELHDAVNALATAPQTLVRPGRSAAFSAEIGGDERLIVVCEVGRRVLLDPVPVKDAVRIAVAGGHGIALYEIVPLEPSRLPRTSSGKARRTLSRERFLARALCLETESEVAE